MPGVSLLFVAIALLVLVAVLGFPILLYRGVTGEEPGRDRGTSWNDARERAKNEDGTNSRGNEKTDETEGNHWS